MNQAGTDVVGWFWRIAHALGVPALPLFLITFNLRLVAMTPWLYAYGFSAYDIPLVTGLGMDQLLSAAAQTGGYFQDDTEPLRVIVERDGQPFELYNSREVAHMADVKMLFQRARIAEDLSGGYLLGLLGVGLWLRKAPYLRDWLQVLMRGGLLTGGLVLLIGLGALVAFDTLFLQFHLLSFTNNLWMLNPAQDYLIMMYPAAFFRDAALAIGALSLLEAAMLAGVAKVLGSWIAQRASFVSGP